MYEIIFICKFSTISTTKALFIQHHYIFIHDLLPSYDCELSRSSTFPLTKSSSSNSLQMAQNKKKIFGKNAIAIENHFIHVAHKLGVGNCLGIKYSVILEEFVNCPFLVYISTCVAYKNDNTHNHNHHQGLDGSPLSRLLFHAMCFLYISEVEFSEMSSYVSIYLFSHMHTSYQMERHRYLHKMDPSVVSFHFQLCSYTPALLLIKSQL